ncbi:MAG: filamentous hemagglutinin N-terminal domain-containing protein [Burkholderiales bacterium]|nr:filamentous hemagglutinin N-terminal domain-containing protein [Burkholderiales bacterium]
MTTPCVRQRRSSSRPRLTVLAAALVAGGLSGLGSLPAAAAPEGGTVRAGTASIQVNGAQTRIDQSSSRAVIDWRAFGVGAAEQVLFVQPSAQSATLNRVTGDQLSVILGRIDANGQVFLVNPNGVVFGRGAQVNVGGLVASTANVGNADFMAGRLNFREPGRPGAGVVNEGRITAAEGGLVALVAPHVRNDGLIQARLGRVTLGAGDTFALDLYGDGLISLAVDPAQAGRLLDASHASSTGADDGSTAAGRPAGTLIAQTGRIEADGGRVVLVSAASARSALDRVINLSGSVRADTVQQQGGRIVLLANGGTAQVSGSLSAQGRDAGQAGGHIEVLGERVHLTPGAAIDASGAAGGGTVHVGGAYQGSGSTVRAGTTTVDAGARIAADARAQGRGGEVVVWSDGSTAYAGSISARGGATGGDGGRVEVSGRGTLDFNGMVDAGAASGWGGAAGTLLLDPAIMNIGLAEASLISRVLRTGTSTTVSAELDINVGATIDGRGRLAGGGLTLAAGRDINVGEFIVTNNGAVRLDATTGTVRIAPGRGIFTGNAPITVRTGGDLAAGAMVTSGALSLTSTGGSIALDTALDAGQGAVTVNAADDVRINQPVVNLRNGSGFTAVAGGDIVVNAQIDGRGGTPGVASGAVDLSAGGSVRFNESVITQLADIRARAIAGTIVTAAGQGLFSLGAAGTPGAAGGAIDLSAGGDFTTGLVSTTGPLRLTSTGGGVTIGQGIDATVGNVTITAATDANLDTDILNLRSGASLAVSAGRDIFVRAQVDGRNGAAAGGGATLVAGRHVTLTDSITTNGGAIGIMASTGTVTQATGVQLRTGAAPIDVSAGADLVTASYVTTGVLNLRSTGGSLAVAESIYDSTGATTLTAATDVTIRPGALVENIRTGAPLAISAGRDIIVDEQVGQDRNATTLTGPITLTAGRNVAINQDVVTRDAPLTITASTGTVTVAPQTAGPNGPQPQVRAGSGAITVVAGADLYIGTPSAPRPNAETPYLTTGALSLSSTAGTLFIEAPIPNTTGRVTLNGGNAVQVNERIYSNGADISITAGLGGIVMNAATMNVVHPVTNVVFPTVVSDIDAQQGNLTLTARGDINAPSVRTAGTLTITSTEGRILSGDIVDSRDAAGTSLGMPQLVRLAGALGIDSFSTRNSPDVEARSSQGSVTLSVNSPQRLYIEAARDVSTGGSIGAQVELVAGRDVLLGRISTAGLLRVRAGQDFVFGGADFINGLLGIAGRDIRLTGTPLPGTALVWLEGSGGTMTLRDPASLGTEVTIRGLSLTAGRDVDLPQPVHVSDTLRVNDGIEPSLLPTTISAGRHISLGQLETTGDVSLSSSGGNVTVGFPIGAPVPVLAPAIGLWNAAGLGVNSLSVSALGTGAVISLQGARSVGNISLVAPNGGTVNFGAALTSSAGSVTVDAPNQNPSVVAIAQVPRLVQPGIVAGVVSPGPLRAGPDGPLIAAAPAPGAPGLPEILVSAPGAIDAGAGATPGQASTASGETTAEQAASAARSSAAATASSEGAEAEAEPAAGSAAAAARPVVLYSGGRGAAQSADLGRSGNYGSAPVPQDDSDEARKRRRAAAAKKR